MLTHRMWFLTAFAFLSAASIAPSSGAAVITYLNSTRYVQAGARVDAIGFTNFSQSLESFDIIFGAPRNIERASQFSQLLSDRIIAQCSAETAAQVGSGANGATSWCVVTFSIADATPYRLDVGPVFFRTSGGGAEVSLR
ncbi:MAG: hypothetical protein K2W85_13160, partial [Phycisphaerales bacterium]|nr:hypothetical protein [Phycisphaerales bacterium]